MNTHEILILLVLFFFFGGWVGRGAGAGTGAEVGAATEEDGVTEEEAYVCGGGVEILGLRFLFLGFPFPFAGRQAIPAGGGSRMLLSCLIWSKVGSFILFA